jgi:hypothetical protein
MLNIYVLLFGVVRLAWRDLAMDLIKALYKIMCRSRKEYNGDPGNDQTSVWWRKHEPYTDVWMAYSVQDRPEKARRVKSKACSLFSLTSKGLLTKNLASQAKQPIPHTTLTFYCDCVKIWEDFSPKFDDERTGCCITTTLRLILPFHQWIFVQKQHDYRPHPPYFSLFSHLNIILKNRHFDTVEVIDVESQAVLITFTEKTTRMHLKMAQALWKVHTRGRGLCREKWRPVDPELVFSQMAAPVMEIVDGSSYFVMLQTDTINVVLITSHFVKMWRQR